MFLHSDPSLFRWFCEFVCITMDNDLSDAIHLQSLYCISYQAYFHFAYMDMDMKTYLKPKRCPTNEMFSLRIFNVIKICVGI